MDHLALTRRQLLKTAAAAAAAWQAAPWLLHARRVYAQTPPLDPETQMTLEAFSDTLIPGEKRSPDDRAIAGAASGPGAVQAGAIELMTFPAAGAAPAMPGLAAAVNGRATQYAAAHAILLDPTVPPLVSFDFAQRTAFLVEILDGNDPEKLVYFALAGLAFIAYHSAAHLHLYDAVRNGHPGLAAIHFPQPDADNFWRFPEFSYQKALATKHPLTTRRGSPA